MENNKLLFAVFTICVVILVLLVVQMCILVPAMMNSAPAHAPAFSGHHNCCPPRFWCHPHKMMPPKPGVLPKAPAEPQAKAAPVPSK